MLRGSMLDAEWPNCSIVTTRHYSVGHAGKLCVFSLCTVFNGSSIIFRRITLLTETGLINWVNLHCLPNAFKLSGVITLSMTLGGDRYSGISLITVSP